MPKIHSGAMLESLTLLVGTSKNITFLAALRSGASMFVLPAALPRRPLI